MQAILNWLREFLILYLILTIYMQLAAAEQYKKYLRFLSGMILLLVLITPVLRLTGSEWDITRAYDQFWEQMDDFSKEADDLKTRQSGYELQNYEDAVASSLAAQAQEQGIMVSQVRVRLSSDYKIQSVSVWLDVTYKRAHPSAAERLTAFLKETYGLKETQMFIDS